MGFDREKRYVICGIGFQTESIVEYMKLERLQVVCVLTDKFTQRPEDCYLIPSKRKSVRNSFSELDMMMDCSIKDVPVKRYDMLSNPSDDLIFVYYEDEQSIKAFNTIIIKTKANTLKLTVSEIESINNTVWDNGRIINELWNTNRYLYSEVENLKNCMRRQMKSTVFDFHFEFHLVEHCNLKCAGCTHFASLANEEYADIEEFKKDINRLSELTGGIARFINLLGGEPLLHPQICDFLVATRKAFPKTIIRVVTNGIKLMEMGEVFWSACRENKIIVGVTQYPIDIDYDERLKKIESEGVTYESFSGNDLPRDEMWRLCLDEIGKNRPTENFIRCPRANACIFVKHGKVFNCATMANIEHYNKCFGTLMDICEADYADIYICESIDEILNKLCNPKPFCRYCNIEDRKYGSKWKTTNVDRSEWEGCNI